jgi:protein-S-isoprenylcysteine O-methyltransferase Ste14
MGSIRHGERDPGGFRPRVLPPVWAAITAVAMVGAGRWLEARELAQVSQQAADAMPWPGVAVLLAGVALTTWSAWHFVTAETPIEPGRVSTELLTGGPYAFSRNPIYVGMAIGLIGFAMFLGQPATIALVPVFLGVLQWRIIRHEERMLTERFGDEYAAYCARVRRWL